MAQSRAQQATKAISMKKAGKKPKMQKGGSSKKYQTGGVTKYTPWGPKVEPKSLEPWKKISPTPMPKIVSDTTQNNSSKSNTPAWMKQMQEDMKKKSGTTKLKKGGSTPTWQRKEGKNPSGGLNARGVASYRKQNPGSKLQTAVTTKPSKLKAGSKDAKRRKSFCSRMEGMKKKLTSSKTANDPNSRINKSLRKWNC